MVQVDLPAAFTLGQMYALIASKFLKKEPNLYANKLLGPINFYMSCGFAPVGMFLMVGWPSWEVMYTNGWVENVFNNPAVAAFYVLFGVAMVLLGNFGFILGHYWYLKGKDQYVTIGTIIGAILTFLPFALRWGVWMKIGTFSEIQAGGGYPFFSPPFFHGWLAIISFGFISIVLTAIWIRNLSNRN